MKENPNPQSETEISGLRNNNTKRTAELWQSSFLHINAIIRHLVLYGGIGVLIYIWDIYKSHTNNGGNL